MKKILVFGLSEYFGGIESYFLNMVSNINLNYIFDFVPENIEIAQFGEFEKYNCKLHNVVNWRKNPIKYSKQIYNLLRDNAYDGIYMNLLSAFNVIPILIAHFLKIKVIIVHSHNSSQPTNIVKLIIHNINKRIISSYATNRFACSELAANWMFYTSDKYIILPNAIDTDKFKVNIEIRNKIRKEYSIDEETLLLGFVGRLAEQKNPLFLVDIMSELIKVEDKVKLMIVGDGYLKKKLLKKIKKLELENNIIVLGSKKNINHLMNAFEFLLLPSKFEGLGIVLIEAQYSGVKCLVSNQIPNEANISNTLEYIAIDNPKKWGDIILKLKNHTDLEDRENIVKQCNPKYSLKFASGDFKLRLYERFNYQK